MCSCSVHFHRQAKKVELNEDVVSTHWFGWRFPSAWARFVYVKRAMPRWLIFPMIFILTLAVNAIWVIPITLTYMHSCNTVIDDDMCVTWAADGPNSSWYNPNQTAYSVPSNLKYRLYRPASTTFGDYRSASFFNGTFASTINLGSYCPNDGPGANTVDPWYVLGYDVQDQIRVRIRSLAFLYSDWKSFLFPRLFPFYCMFVLCQFVNSVH